MEANTKTPMRGPWERTLSGHGPECCRGCAKRHRSKTKPHAKTLIRKQMRTLRKRAATALAHEQLDVK